MLKGNQRLLSLTIAGVVLVTLVLVGRYYLNRYYTAPMKLQTAYAKWSQGQHAEAEAEAWQAYQLDPHLTDAALFAAEIASEHGRFTQANDYASHLTNADSETRLKAYRLLAHIAHRRTYQFSQAETNYRLALGLAPDDIEAQTGLANLLGLCGRRTEAVPIVLNLVRLGSPSDLLMLLAREDAIINDTALIDQARTASPDDPLPLISQAWLKGDQGEYQAAIALLREALKLNGRSDAVRPMIMKYLAASGQLDQLRSEIITQASLREQLESWPDYWLAMAQLAESEKRWPEATRCYGEAVLRAPDSKMAVARLSVLLNQSGDADAAKIFEVYSQKMQALKDAQEHVFFAAAQPDVSKINALLDAYVQVGRLWEALGWCRSAGAANPSLRSQLTARTAELEKLTSDKPLSLVLPELSPCRHWKLDQYPLPTWSERQTAVPSDLARNEATSVSAVPNTQSLISFRNDASTSGFQFQYLNGTDSQPQRRMYEFPGGGIAVLDFDNDGRPDMAVSQGSTRPPRNSASDQRDKLFRNLDSQQFQAVPSETLGDAESDGFGQGIGTGDMNSDGFADLYVAQIGQNRLLINNGDGTFHDATLEATIDNQQWTTSCLVADLSGDGLPDLYDVNYVEGDDVFQRICVDHSGQPAMCMPTDFESAQQILWLNQGDGTFRNGTELMQPQPKGKGLGCLAFTAPGSHGLSLLIANDTTPNFLYSPERSTDHSIKWNEHGVLSGVAFSAAGKAQGCMGIAADDINSDGQLDLVITNFLNESSTFYSGSDDLNFRDDTMAVDLTDPTRNVLGFGTQFIDADNDGTSELFMANGHIDDLRRRDLPYQMPPQLFQFRSGRFQLMKSQAVGEYFTQLWIGRSAVRLDWNADGLTDLAVGHLDQPYALLTNTTPTSGNWLQLRLVGTRSNRDAIGTQISVTAGGQRHWMQLTAGDGYMASNQRVISVGLGLATVADRIELIWPSGQMQILENVNANAQLLIVEP